MYILAMSTEDGYSYCKVNCIFQGDPLYVLNTGWSNPSIAKTLIEKRNIVKLGITFLSTGVKIRKQWKTTLEKLIKKVNENEDVGFLFDGEYWISLPKEIPLILKEKNILIGNCGLQFDF